MGFRGFVAALLVAALAACGHAPPPPAPTAGAAPPLPPGAEELTVVLSDFAFAPSRIAMTAGRSYRLHLVNRGSGHHDLTAPDFFRTVRSARPLPADGRVVLAAGEEAAIDLTPTAPGTYPFECSVFLHSLFGMTGAFVVD